MEREGTWSSNAAPVRAAVGAQGSSDAFPMKSPKPAVGKAPDQTLPASSCAKPLLTLAASVSRLILFMPQTVLGRVATLLVADQCNRRSELPEHPLCPYQSDED